jgi:hypothetical protein
MFSPFQDPRQFGGDEYFQELKTVEVNRECPEVRIQPTPFNVTPPPRLKIRKLHKKIKIGLKFGGRIKSLPQGLKVRN